MKKLSFVFIILLLSATFMSCATAITVGKTIPKYELSKLYASPEMDFIGAGLDLWAILFYNIQVSGL